MANSFNLEGISDFKVPTVPSDLALTTFFSGPDDDLIVVDTYSKTDSSVVNSIQAIENNPQSDTFVSAQSQMPVPYSDKLQRLVDPAEVAKRFSGDDNQLKSLYRNLSSAVTKACAINKNLSGVVRAVVGGKIGNIISKGISDATNIAGLVNRFTNGNYAATFKDVGAVSGLITSLAVQGSRLGLPNVFSKMAASISDKVILFGAARELLPNAFKTGNMDMFLDVTTTSIGKSISRIIPDAASSMISGFKLPSSLEAKDWAGYYDKVNTGLTVVDAAWKLKSRAGSDILSLRNIRGGVDFLKLVEAKVFSKQALIPNTSNAVGPQQPSLIEDEKFMLLMKKYKTSTVEDDLRKMFPTIKLSPSRSFRDHEITQRNFNESSDNKFYKGSKDIFDPNDIIIT